MESNAKGHQPQNWLCPGCADSQGRTVEVEKANEPVEVKDSSYSKGNKDLNYQSKQKRYDLEGNDANV